MIAKCSLSQEREENKVNNKHFHLLAVHRDYQSIGSITYIRVFMNAAGLFKEHGIVLNKNAPVFL